MAKPVYIMCAEKVIVDRATNTLSFITVLEEMQISTVNLKPGDPLPSHDGRLGIDFNVLSLWERDSGEEGKAYDTQILLTMPGEQEQVVGTQAFAFEKSRHRMTGRILGVVPTQSGTMIVGTRIRPQAGGEWISQAYKIAVAVTKQEQSAPAQESQPSPS